MASTKISDETTASSLTGTELVPVVQSGSNRKTTTQDIADLASGGWGYTLVTATSATLADSNRFVDVDTSAVSAPGTTTLTLPTPSAGRVFIIQKTNGAADETITLARAGSETIEGVAASFLLTDSANSAQAAHSTDLPRPMWIVMSDGTNWRVTQVANLVRHIVTTVAPSDSTHTVESAGAYVPGSTWWNSFADKMYMAMQVHGTGATSWQRIDAVDVQSVTSNTTLSGKDLSVFVSTASGAVTLTLPSPAGRHAGRQFSITKTNTGTNKIVLARNGSESINGAASSLDPLPGSDAADYGRWHVVSDGTNWWVTGGSGLV